MKRSIIVTLIISILIVVITMGHHSTINASSQDIDTVQDFKQYQENAELPQNYYNINEKFNKLYTPGEESFVISPLSIDGGLLYSKENSFNYKSQTLSLSPGDEIEFELDLSKQALYQIYLDYYVLDTSRLAPNITILINDEIQFIEMNLINLEIYWSVEQERNYDRFGDQLLPKSFISSSWNYNKGLVDPNYFHYLPLNFLLNSGTNNIKIKVNEGYLLLGDINVKHDSGNLPSYNEYYLTVKDNEKVKDKIELEAEDYSLKSKRSISSQYQQDASVTPYSYKNRVLNVINGNNYQNGGDSILYKFSVNKSGLYKIAFKYYISGSNSLPSYREIKIDDEVLFEELKSYKFKYSTKWKNEVLKDDNGEAFWFYLEEGVHTVELKVNYQLAASHYYKIINILEEISTIALDVKQITGGLIDKDRKWKITRYLPDLQDRLGNVTYELDDLIVELGEYLGKKNSPIISQLKAARKSIKDFYKDPELLPTYMNRFEGDDSSAYAKINLVLPALLSQPIFLDKLFIYGDVKIPKANVNIFKRITSSFSSFIYSFFNPKYKISNKQDSDTIKVWVNKSRIYMELMQRMTDELFTPETGIKVQLELMNDENKIILSNVAKTTPDAVLGVSSGRPFELALRGIIEDLSTYDDFDELSGQYNPNTFIPYIYGDGVYAIPETQDVSLMFYRKDIFTQLNLDIPDTWEDVVNILPTIQKYNMNFYSPLGSSSSYKGFGSTTPLIYQHGGSLYNIETVQTIVNRAESYQAFEFMTDLFTVYNLPIQTANFFQHFRTGKIPVGIMGAGTYIQLKYAAPELAGLWGVMPVPGIKNEEGVTERWDPTFGQSSIIFSRSTKKDLSWDFLKWWHSSNIQSEFSYEIQSTLGDKFLYMTANLDAFKDSAWPSESKETLLEQWKWIRSTGKVPGDYMLERELSNAWNKVVLNGVNPRIAIDEAILVINNELNRKLNEFGYVDNDGNLIKEYIIPTHENITRWIKDNDRE